MNPTIIIRSIVFSTAWIYLHCQACQGDLPQEVVLDWLKRRILEELGLDKPPVPTLQSLSGQRVHVAAQHGAWRVRREARLDRRQHQEISQVILFPRSGQWIHFFSFNLNILLFRLGEKNNIPFCAVCYQAQYNPFSLMLYYWKTELDLLFKVKNTLRLSSYPSHRVLHWFPNPGDLHFWVNPKQNNIFLTEYFLAKHGDF